MSLVKFPVVLFTTLLLLPVLDFTNASNDLDKPYKFVHPQGKSERELSICEENAPCSVIQNPFFFPFIVKRICRCKNKECPDTYEVKRSMDTVFINNREQMKFCDDLPKCPRGILRVDKRDDLPMHLNCYCPKKTFWRRLTPAEVELENPDPKTDIENPSFTCEKLKRCRKTCGTLRSDLYATYQNCSCPIGHLCLPTNRTDVNEALYDGPGFISSCIVLTG